MDDGFYLKLTTEQASQMISSGISSLFGGVPETFTNYTYSVLDTSTGDLYWKVENYVDPETKIKYDIIGFLEDNFPELKRYSQEQINQYMPQSDM